jgi:tetratricopeptide (TPR) repeat protein
LHVVQEAVAKRDHAAAEAALGQIWSIAMDCIPARLLAAKLYLEAGQLEEVIAETGRVIRLQPNHIEALLMRGQAFFSMEVRSDSGVYFSVRRRVVSTPVQTCNAVQDFDLAKRHYGEVITKFDPDNQDAKALFKKVKDLQKRVAKVDTVRHATLRLPAPQTA